MQGLSYWLINMSITATLIGFAVTVLRSIKRIPKRISVLLWLAPFIRMTLPFGAESKYSLMSLLSEKATKKVTFFQVEDIPMTFTNYVQHATTYFPITFEVKLLEEIFETATTVWYVVFATLILTFSVLYFTTLHEIKDAEKAGDGVYYSDKITFPAVYGILFPKIVLPSIYRERDTKYVLLHERAHIRRKDNLWRVIAFTVTALHWFNPFAWLF